MEGLFHFCCAKGQLRGVIACRDEFLRIVAAVRPFVGAAWHLGWIWLREQLLVERMIRRKVSLRARYEAAIASFKKTRVVRYSGIASRFRSMSMSRTIVGAIARHFRIISRMRRGRLSKTRSSMPR